MIKETDPHAALTDHPEHESTPSNKRDPSIIYGHLFPGNYLADLPRGGVLNLLNILGHTLAREHRFRELRYVSAISEGHSYAEREDLKRPTQHTMAYLFREVEPIDVDTSESKLNQDNLVDLIDVEAGEHLGGAIQMEFKGGGPGLRTYRRLESGDTPQPYKEITLIGILDHEKRPAGIIYYGTGDKPKTPVTMDRATHPKLVMEPI